MPAYKNLSATVTRDDLSATIKRDDLAKTETDIVFLNHFDSDLSLGGVFGDLPCDGVIFLQNLTTIYKSRWLSG